MNTSCKELRRISREKLNRKYAVPMSAFITTQLLGSLIEYPFLSILGDHPTMVQTIILYVVRFLILVITGVLTFGLTRIHLNLARGKEFRVSQLFDPFRNQTDRYFLTSALLTVAELLLAAPFLFGIYLVQQQFTAFRVLCLAALGVVSLVLLVVFYLNFQLLHMVLLDHEQMPLLDAVKVALGLMKGKKGRLFALYLRFAGMLLLGILSFGIGFLWVFPYQSQTLANFYLDLIGELPATIPTPPQNPAYQSFNRQV